VTMDAREQQVNRLLMQIDVGKRQMEQMGRQAQMLESAMQELSTTIEALDGIRGQKPGANIMMPVGAGTYMKAALTDLETVIVGVGAEMFVEKKLPDAVETLRLRQQKLSESYANVQKSIGELGGKLSQMSSQAEQMMGQTQ